MNVLRLSGKVLLAAVSLALGATIYVLSPAVRLVPLQYWLAVGIYVIAAEVAWHLAETQTAREPGRLARVGPLSETLPWCPGMAEGYCLRCIPPPHRREPVPRQAGAEPLR